VGEDAGVEEAAQEWLCCCVTLRLAPAARRGLVVGERSRGWGQDGGGSQGKGCVRYSGGVWGGGGAWSVGQLVA
jgi:hypothetical protein